MLETVFGNVDCYDRFLGHVSHLMIQGMDSTMNGDSEDGTILVFSSATMTTMLFRTMWIFHDEVKLYFLVLIVPGSNQM